jgi:hypothetical protein
VNVRQVIGIPTGPASPNGNPRKIENGFLLSRGGNSFFLHAPYKTPEEERNKIKTTNFSIKGRQFVSDPNFGSFLFASLLGLFRPTGSFLPPFSLYLVDSSISS